MHQYRPTTNTYTDPRRLRLRPGSASSVYSNGGAARRLRQRPASASPSTTEAAVLLKRLQQQPNLEGLMVEIVNAHDRLRHTLSEVLSWVTEDAGQRQRTRPLATLPPILPHLILGIRLQVDTRARAHTHARTHITHTHAPRTYAHARSCARMRAHVPHTYVHNPRARAHARTRARTLTHACAPTHAHTGPYIDRDAGAVAEGSRLQPAMVRCHTPTE